MPKNAYEARSATLAAARAAREVAAQLPDPTTLEKPTRCYCKNSGCLKLYCVCFKEGKYSAHRHVTCSSPFNRPDLVRGLHAQLQSSLLQTSAVARSDHPRNDVPSHRLEPASRLHCARLDDASYCWLARKPRAHSHRSPAAARHCPSKTPPFCRAHLSGLRLRRLQQYARKSGQDCRSPRVHAPEGP